MPNWCYTQFIFHGDKKEIEDFHQKLEQWTSKEFVKSDFGKSWLGNVLCGAGLGDRIDSKTDGLRCRGAIEFLDGPDVVEESDEGIIVLDTSTAWAPMPLMWVEVIKKLGYKTVGFSYSAEEPGCDVYEVYDPYGDFPERYYVDGYISEEDECPELLQLRNISYYSDDDLLKRHIQKFLKTDECDLKTLIKTMEDYKFKNDDTYISIHEYGKVDVIEE